MKNIDKYRNVVDDSLKVSGNPLCRIRVYTNCCPGKERNCCACKEETFAWLFQEYNPSLLKNGDGLKPGDWIMVKIFEDGEWAKRQFAFFHDGWFYYLRGGNNFAQLHLYGLLRSVQARLPEEGE